MHASQRAVHWTGALVFCSSLALTAHAQQQGTTSEIPTQKSAKTEQIETIVVNATKRPEDVAKVPLSVTVIGGEALEEQHITNFVDLTRSVPNLSFSRGAAGGRPRLGTLQVRRICSPAGPRTVCVHLRDHFVCN